MREPDLDDDPDAVLRSALMEEYVSEQGLSFDDLESLDSSDRESLMLEAAAYAALRLCERAFFGNRTES